LPYLKRCSELPTAQHYILVAAWIFHTYVMEWWHYSPYLLLDGPPEHGKTRTGKATIYAARRGVHTETLRAPNLIRDARDRGATILLDVMYVWRKAERLGCEDILLQRFERGAKAGRVLHPDRGPFDDTEYYDIFGPTVIATNESAHGILGTRCIPINLPYSTQRFESLDPEDGLPFRERLTAWRARVFDQQSALSENPAAGRLGDILQPLATIIDCVAADERPAFDRIVEELEDRQRQERSDTVEARILKVLLELTEHVRRGYLALSYITSQLNLAPETIGRRLRCLGLTTEKRTGGRMYLRWNERAIERLAIKYGVLDAD
jgi:hypothetical protein